MRRIENFITWREQHIREKDFVLFLSLIVGVLSALAASLLKIGRAHV